MKVPADAVSGEGPLPPLPMAGFSLYLHTDETETYTNANMKIPPS